ncbi:MAG: PilC/PilY family type IV pilus protein [bacterium]
MRLRLTKRHENTPKRIFKEMNIMIERHAPSAAYGRHLPWKAAMCAIAAAFLLCVLSPRAWPESLDIRVSSSEDDAEERVSDGVVDCGSSALEMIQESSDQIVGIRFRDVTVPRGAAITNAYIEFKTDETSSVYTTLYFKGEASDNAAAFSESGNHTISGRARTSEVVSWQGVPAWDQKNKKHQTPDLSPIIQEIVDRDGWTAGNALAIIITGSGKRVAKSYDKGNNKSGPLLHLEYESAALDIRVAQNSDDAEEKTNGDMRLHNDDLDLIRKQTDQTVGIRFQGINVPRGAWITTAYISFEAAGTNSEATNLTIAAESTDDAGTFSNTSGDITRRSTTSASISWNNVPAWSSVGERHSTPDLSAIVREITGRPGWEAGNDMVFIISGSGKRVAASRDNAQGKAPLLHIEYDDTSFPFIVADKASLGAVCYEGNDAAGDGFTITNSGSAAMDFTITDDADWVSVSPASGTLTTGGSSPVVVSYHTESLDAGTYEATIIISDPDAPNSPLEIDLSVTIQPIPESVACGHVPVYTENLVNPAIMILLDLSGSMGTKVAIAAPGENPRTPDLSHIVREIVDRPGWCSGNAMAFIITGTGCRTAESYDGESGSAPLLHVEYIHDGTHVLDVRVSHGDDDAEEAANGKVSRSSSDLELVRDGSDQTVGIRFQNVTIPPEADIAGAYIEFVVDEKKSGPTSLTIRGEAMDDPPRFSKSNRNISNRTTTEAYAAWSDIPAWSVPTQQTRIAIARSVISELVEDKSIAWGFGTWRSNEHAGYTAGIDYTKIHVGCRPNDPNHQLLLQQSISTKTEIGGATPFAPSILAAEKYYTGRKRDREGDGEYYVDIRCQPKFLIEITDGLGNVDSTNDTVRQRTNDLCDEGVTPIAVGFGIDDATQIQIMAGISNQRGHASDDLYALHDEVNGVGQPFLAYSEQALKEALAAITERIKGQIFHGAAPVPTTSSDHGDIVIMAEFDATDWSGDLVATTFDQTTGGWDRVVWRASEAMPAYRTVFTIDPSDEERVIPYTDSVLPHDHWLCKDIGDIIRSTPIIVGDPPFYYPFDGYTAWKRGIIRDPVVYVGANDGSLHAFHFSDGRELWAFVPHSSHDKLNRADDPVYDLCDNHYCHQYFVDGSPRVGDIHTGTAWMTLLVCGLREGGESYFALDITHGRPFGVTSGARYLWEFSDAELGQTWADPSIERVSDGNGAAWGIFFGSGYASSDQREKEAYLYGIAAHNKAPLWKNGSTDINRIKISETTLKNDALASPLVADLDADTMGDHLYAGNLYGTMYRITSIGKGELPRVTRLFGFDTLTRAHPVRAQATFAYGVDEGGIWVYFGTGRYETQADKTSMSQQYLFGLKDTLSAPPVYSLGDLVRLRSTLTEYRDGETGETRPVKIVEGGNESRRSWALSLDASSPDLVGSERVLEQPLVVAGIVYFTTFIPDQDICAGNGDTWVYALEYDTGLPPITPVFDLNEDGVFDERDKVTDEEGVVYSIAAVQVGSGQGSKPVLHKDTLFVTTTNEEVAALDVNPDQNRATLTSWKDKTI